MPYETASCVLLQIIAADMQHLERGIPPFFPPGMHLLRGLFGAIGACMSSNPGREHCSVVKAENFTPWHLLQLVGSHHSTAWIGLCLNQRRPGEPPAPLRIDHADLTQCQAVPEKQVPSLTLLVLLKCKCNS